MQTITADVLIDYNGFIFVIILLQKKVRFFGMEEQVLGVRLDPRQIECASAVLMAVVRVV